MVSLLCFPMFGAFSNILGTILQNLITHNFLFLPLECWIPSLKSRKECCSHWMWTLRPAVVAEGRGTYFDARASKRFSGPREGWQVSKKAPEGQHKGIPVTVACKSASGDGEGNLNASVYMSILSYWNACNSTWGWMRSQPKAYRSGS